MGRAPGLKRGLIAVGPYLAYAALALWTFSGPLFEGRVLYFRDLSIFYYPNYVFLARALAQGVWPLWNPAADAGAPFLTNAYPLDLLLVRSLGAAGALALGPPLHLLLAMSGGFFLGRRLGMERWGAWTAGACFGLGGYLLSCVNLLPLFQAAALAPWVIGAALALFDRPSGRTIAATAVLAALQLSTIAGEIVTLTWLALPFLRSRPPARRGLLGLGVAALLAALLTAPVLLNARATLSDTQRAAGFDPVHALGYSARVPVLLEALLPRFLGDVHAFTDRGFWGQRFFPEGNPYFLSLYLGPCVLVAVIGAGRHRAWLLVLLGILLSLGEHGPLSFVSAMLRFFRAPVKFFFLSALGLSLLAGFGVSRQVQGHRARLWAMLPGAMLTLGGVLLAFKPTFAAAAFGAWLPELNHPRALQVAQVVWPGRFVVTGLLAMAAGFALTRGGRLARLAPLPLCLDLLIVNVAINPAASRDFYELRPSVKGLVQSAEAEGRYRWFSYGVANASGLTWAPEILRRNTDVWLYYFDRQSLLPRAHVLDGLEGAFDNDRTGMAPRGSTLEVAESRPEFFSTCYTRLRMAGVRWVFSFDPLPGELVTRRGEAPFPELSPPLSLYELRDPLPRAFWVGRAEVETDGRRYAARVLDPAFPARESVLLSTTPPGGTAPASASSAEGTVRFEQVDPHHVRLSTTGPPGFVVVLVGYHPDWRAAGPSGEWPLLRANGRYWALPTPGGDQQFDVRFAPRWTRPAFLLAGLGAAACALLARGRAV